MSMTRRDLSRRGLLAVGLSGVLIAGLAGCGIVSTGPDSSEETPVDFGTISTAVPAATPRVVDVRDPQQSRNGFGHRFGLGLICDSGDPFTTEELDAVVEAIWRTLPWEPNTIKLTAGADTDGVHDVVDLRSAAAGLDGLSVTNAGQGGVSLTGMAERYGAWTAPE